MTSVFVGAEQRLRAGWRIALEIVGFLILSSVVGGIQARAVEERNASTYALGSCIYLFAGLGLAWVYGRWIDRRDLVAYGFHTNRAWWLDLGAGFVLGAVLLTAVFVIERAMGWVTIRSWAHTSFRAPFILAGVGSLLAQAAVGVNEELAFRGYLLRNLAEGLSYRGRTVAAVVAATVGSSLCFGFAHAANPGATLWSSVNVIVAGLLLSLGYVVTGELALPIGLHIAWNFFQEFVYGYPNSGQTPTSWFMGSEVTGPESWTGAASYGPDGGALAAVLALAMAPVIVVWRRRSRGGHGIQPALAEYRQGVTAGAADAAEPAAVRASVKVTRG